MKNILSILLGVLVASSIFPIASASAFDKVDHYQERFPLSNVNDKLVDNRGRGDAGLYGTRNFRAVLNGLVYRGGANNIHHITPRQNMNPLQNDALENLCEEGFGNSIYLYSTNYPTAPTLIRCRSPWSETQSLNYGQQSVLTDPQAPEHVLKLVYELVVDPSSQPIYLHCWNGWHASGFISALILRQFCDLSGDEAVAYWDKNTDGNNTDPKYQRIRKRIRDFVPDPSLSISNSRKQKICF